MRALVTIAANLSILALIVPGSVWPQSGPAQTQRTQSDRDYVFTDGDGHLILRFTGRGGADLDEAQAYEILNQEFSRMVHDRLHADIQFAEERRDPQWAATMEPRIAAHLQQIDVHMSDVIVQCRALSCRVIVEQPGHRDIPEHQVTLGTVQDSLEYFVEQHPEHFLPGFLITAYFQETSTSHVKAFLRRTIR